MKLSAFLFVVVCALVAVSATTRPFYHPLFPTPHQGGSAPPPSSHHGSFPSFPPSGDVTKCWKAAEDSSAKACSVESYDAGECCTYQTGLGESCTYIPYLETPIFKGIIKHVCDGGSEASD